MISAADAEVLEELVDDATFSRGLAYAQSGAVKSRTWSPARTRVVGEVQGSAPRPYVASVNLVRDEDGVLTGISATCTCPVGYDCKHALALVLADGTDEAVAPAPMLSLVGAEPPGVGDDWELPLQPLVADDEEGESEHDDGDVIGLQFELLLDTARANVAGPGVRVRPVIPSGRGTWVRSGISWGNLDYFRYGQRMSDQGMAQLDLVKEFRELSRLAIRRSFSTYADEVVRLEMINSRRLWDLLREAKSVGLPLLSSGRVAREVGLWSEPALVSLDITRTAPGLHVEPRIGSDDETLPLETSMLLGRPAHGIAWWVNEGSGSSAKPALVGLAPLVSPVDDALRTFLRTATVDIPTHDEPRFFKNFVPRLRRKIALSSSDHSVELPEVLPNRLTLVVEITNGHHLALKWQREEGNGTFTEDLWPQPNMLPEIKVDPSVFRAVERVVSQVPGLMQYTFSGTRIAAEVQLDSMASVAFLTETVPRLRALEGVRVDVRGEMPEFHETDSAPVVSFSGAETDDRDWFDLTVTVTVDEEPVPFTELFLALAEGREFLVLPSGTYFSLDAPELQELATLIAEARELEEVTGEGVRLSRFQVSLWDEILRLGSVSAQAKEWEDRVRALVGAEDRPVNPPPAGLKATLRPYQQTGFDWLAYLYTHRLGGVLADDMGLGKTIQALALMGHVFESGLGDAPFLVVAPTSVVGNWAAEAHRFAPDLRVVVVTGTERRRGEPLPSFVAEADLVVTSYSLFRLEYDAYASVSWAGLFLDEAQFAKNRSSQAYLRAKMLPVSYKVAMSGTPLENNLMELWSLLSITAPGLFSTPEHFIEQYRNPIEKQGDATKLDQLRRRIRPFMLRRTKEEVERDLPDKQEQVLQVDLNVRQHKIYQTYLQRERQKVLGLLADVNKNRFAIFRSLTLLRQASLAVSLVDPEHALVPSTKLDVMMELLDDIVADGHRVLIFSQFTRFLTMARERVEAAGISCCYLDGRTRNRAEVIRGFQEGSAPVFLISLKAGGFGLNLTEADYCIILDPWWNPATEAQAVDRVHRIGQTRKVMVYRLVAKETIEEKVMALKARKEVLFRRVVDGGGFESGAMTADDIVGLLE